MKRSLWLLCYAPSKHRGDLLMGRGDAHGICELKWDFWVDRRCHRISVSHYKLLRIYSAYARVEIMVAKMRRRKGCQCEWCFFGKSTSRCCLAICPRLRARLPLFAIDGTRSYGLCTMTHEWLGVSMRRPGPDMGTRRKVIVEAAGWKALRLRSSLTDYSRLWSIRTIVLMCWSRLNIALS